MYLSSENLVPMAQIWSPVRFQVALKMGKLNVQSNLSQKSKFQHPMIAMKYRSPTYSRPFLSDPLLSVCVLSALKLFPVHVSHVLCQLLHLPADSSCMAGKIQNIKSTGLIDPIILLVS